MSDKPPPLPQQLIHLGSQVILNFALLDEDGNASPAPGVDPETGEPAPFFPRTLNLARLDHAAFVELEQVVTALMGAWEALFCAGPEPALPREGEVLP